MPNVKDAVMMKFEESFKPVVDALLPHFTQPNNPLQNTKKIEQDILDSLMGKNEEPYLEAGFASIATEMIKLCSIEERQQVEKEWENAQDHFIKAYEELFAEENSEAVRSNATETVESQADTSNFSTMQGLLGISDQTLSIFYKCGCHLFEQEYFKEAYNVFFIIAYLNNQFVDAWIGMGLAAKRNGDTEGAIKAFTMAAETYPIWALPLIYAAQCQAELLNYQDALASLKLAEEVAKSNPEQNPTDCMTTIKDLIQKYQNLSSAKIGG